MLAVVFLLLITVLLFGFGACDKGLIAL